MPRGKRPHQDQNTWDKVEDVGAAPPAARFRDLHVLHFERIRQRSASQHAARSPHASQSSSLKKGWSRELRRDVFTWHGGVDWRWKNRIRPHRRPAVDSLNIDAKLTSRSPAPYLLLSRTAVFGSDGQITTSTPALWCCRQFVRTGGQLYSRPD